MDTEKHHRILEAAEKATPGPWSTAPDEDNYIHFVLGGDHWVFAYCEGRRSASNAACLSLLDPQTVKEIVKDAMRYRYLKTRTHEHDWVGYRLIEFEYKEDVGIDKEIDSQLERKEKP